MPEACAGSTTPPRPRTAYNTSMCIGRLFCSAGRPQAKQSWTHWQLYSYAPYSYAVAPDLSGSVAERAIYLAATCMGKRTRPPRLGREPMQYYTTWSKTEGRKGPATSAGEAVGALESQDCPTRRGSELARRGLTASLCSAILHGQRQKAERGRPPRLARLWGRLESRLPYAEGVADRTVP